MESKNKGTTKRKLNVSILFQGKVWISWDNLSIEIILYLYLCVYACMYVCVCVWEYHKNNFNV